MKVFLLGFMGSGKSYSGKRLAEAFNLSFVDLDEYIETKEGRSIHEIFKKEGEAYFRKVERDSLKEMKDRKLTIISTGGGTPCFFDNMNWMNENGVTVFLETPPQLLAQRLQSAMANRPLLKGFSKEEVINFIEKKLEERNPFYHQTQILYEQKEEGQNVAKDLSKFFYRIV